MATNAMAAAFPVRNRHRAQWLENGKMFSSAAFLPTIVAYIAFIDNGEMSQKLQICISVTFLRLEKMSQKPENPVSVTFLFSALPAALRAELPQRLPVIWFSGPNFPVAVLIRSDTADFS